MNDIGECFFWLISVCERVKAGRKWIPMILVLLPNVVCFGLVVCRMQESVDRPSEGELVGLQAGC